MLCWVKLIIIVCCLLTTVEGELDPSEMNNIDYIPGEPAAYDEFGNPWPPDDEFTYPFTTNVDTYEQIVGEMTAQHRCNASWFQERWAHHIWRDDFPFPSTYVPVNRTLSFDMVEHFLNSTLSTNGIKAPWPEYEKLDNFNPNSSIFDGLSDFCVVMGRFTVADQPKATSETRFALLLPSIQLWNQKVLAVGNSGDTDDYYSWVDMAGGLGVNYAVVSTAWNLYYADGKELDEMSEEGRQDWGWRIFHLAVKAAKEMAQVFNQYAFTEYGFKNNLVDKISADVYFTGCGIGARQGLKEAELFPMTFSAIILGSPIHDPRDWSIQLMRNAQLNTFAHKWQIDPNMLPYLADEIQRQCDKHDRRPDGLIHAQRMCDPDFAPLTCHVEEPHANATTKPCFTADQIARIKAIYGKNYYNGTYHDGTGTVYEGLNFGMAYGSELEWGPLLKPSLAEGTPDVFAEWYIRHFVVQDQHWDWRATNVSQLMSLDDTMYGSLPYSNLQLQYLYAYKHAGGKILMYHGTADTYVNQHHTNELYFGLRNAVFPDTQAGENEFNKDWLRYYLIPGLRHCAGSSERHPWYIGGAGQRAHLSVDRRGSSSQIVYPTFEGEDPAYEAADPGSEAEGPGFEVGHLVARAGDPAGGDPVSQTTGPSSQTEAPVLNTGYPGFEAEAPWLDAAAPGFDAAYPGFEAEYPGFEAGYPGFDGEYPGLDASYSGFDTGDPGLQRDYRHDILDWVNEWVLRDRYYWLVSQEDHLEPPIATTWADPRTPSNEGIVEVPLCQFGYKPQNRIIPGPPAAGDRVNEAADPNSWECVLDVGLDD